MSAPDVPMDRHLAVTLEGRAATERYLELMNGCEPDETNYWRRIRDGDGKAYPNMAGPLDYVWLELKK